MLKRYAVLAVLSFALASSWANAQVVTDMTPERIREAIADEKAVGCYKLKDYGCFTTPYSRVAQAARAARKAYQPFAEADVTPAMVAPMVEVLAIPQPSMVIGSGRVGKPIDVSTVVVMPSKGKDRAAAILPTERTDLDSRYSNLLGATFEARGIAALFPLSVLSAGNEVRIVYDGLGCVDWKFKLHTECAFPFKLKGVK